MGNIDALLDETVEFFQEILKEHQIQVQRREEGPLPPLSFDAEQIRQVLINLLKNAMEAMPQGGTLTINTRTVIQVPIDIEPLALDHFQGMLTDLLTQ